MNTQSIRKHHAAWTVLAAAVFCLVLAPAATAQDVAHVRAGSSGIDFQPLVEHGGMVLTVSGPEGFHHRAEFGAGESPVFSIFDHAGGALPDGSYNWELTAAPTNVQRREALEANQMATRTGTPTGMENRVQSGSFAVIDGAVVAGGETEPGAEGGSSRVGGNRLATKDFVINDDLIVTGSACVGFDCVNGETFGFDTIRLKENNLRIKFEDTSTSSGFPTNDWELTANDSASGGLSRFSILDVNSSRNLFTVEAGASANSIYVDSTSRVGLRTSTPILDLHVATGNTPGLRLEQNTSSGFQAQTWDIAGNEANFFVRDVTGGSRLPLRIRPGAPTSSIDIAASGNVGIGTAAPAAALHVRRTNGSAQVFVEEASTTGAQRTLFNLENNGQVRFRMKDTAQTPEWVFTASNAFQIDNLSNVGVEFQINPDGEILQNGSQIHAPDYVFEPDYELMSLAELRAFVTAEKHLPNVPSAEDIQRDGLSLTKMPLTLLEKIEELTLYTLLLHETVEELKADRDSKSQALTALEERLAGLESSVTER